MIKETIKSIIRNQIEPKLVGFFNKQDEKRIKKQARKNTNTKYQIPSDQVDKISF